MNNGEKYEGGWKNNKKEGEGVLINKKEKYEGEFKNDMKNGKGTIYYDDGSIYDGYFKDDKKIKGLGELYDAFGNVIEDN